MNHPDYAGLDTTSNVSSLENNDQIVIFYPSYGFLSLFDHPDHVPLP